MPLAIRAVVDRTVPSACLYESLMRIWPRVTGAV
jgi:hypothetical protein